MIEFKAKRARQLTLAALLAAGSGALHAIEVAALPEDLTELSLEDLMAVEVVSVSKKAEPLQIAAGAIYVISGEEIRRNGARSIAEALRMVPGLHVARAGKGDYAISARGFNSTSADKMEVLLDGRSVYTPLFSGVFWDALDTYMPDIDRIEVIRGPGATLWGANAVNGVINIVTTRSDSNPGTQVLLEAGKEVRAHGAVRGSGRFGDTGSARFYAKGFELDDSVRADGDEPRDGQKQMQAGFRIDSGNPDGFTMTVSGDVHDGRLRDSAAITGDPIVTETSGANLNARWGWSLGSAGQVDLRGYVDVSERFIPTLFEEQRETYNLDLQHRLVSGAHEWIWGVGYRHSRDETGGAPLLVIFSPQNRSLDTYGAFVQDKISFADGRLKWTIGSKFEHNDFTGFEVQPGTRLGWEISDRLFSWAALSRAVRTPNRLDHDIAIFCAVDIPNFCSAGETVPFGSPDFDSEKLTALEWGIRYTDQRSWSADLALFLNRYDDLKTTETGFGSTTQNRAKATSSGGELSLAWRPAEGLELRGSYSYLGLDISVDGGSTDADERDQQENTDPRHQAALRLAWQPASRFSVDSFLRYVSRLQASEVPAYAEMDLRLAWRPSDNLELALVGRNLFDRAHPEFGEADPGRIEVERDARLQLLWHLK